MSITNEIYSRLKMPQCIIFSPGFSKTWMHMYMEDREWTWMAKLCISVSVSNFLAQHGKADYRSREEAAKPKPWWWEEKMGLWQVCCTTQKIVHSNGGHCWLWLSDIDECTEVCHFFQGIKSSELEMAINVNKAQLEESGYNFDALVSYLGFMVMKKSNNLQSVHMA